VTSSSKNRKRGGVGETIGSKPEKALHAGGDLPGRRKKAYNKAYDRNTAGADLKFCQREST